MLQPEPHTAQDRRRHRILNTLFRELERRGCPVSEEQHKLFVTASGQKLQVQLREKQKQVRRPLTAQERERESWNTSGIKQELHPSGFLIFEIKQWLERPLRSEWLETPTKPLEPMLADIVATMLAAGAVLAERKRAQAAREQERVEQQRRHDEERQRRKLDANRWRRLVELAGARREAAAARELIAAMRAALPADDPQVDGQPVSAWLAWAEARARSADPLSRGVEAIFTDVASVTAWSYRD